jgi:ATP-binding cassette subfamily F protein 3
MLQLKNVTLQRGSKVLLERANLLIHASEKVGIIGSNGAGKSSLFAVLRNQLDCSAGEFELVRNTRIAEIRQDIPTGTESILNYVIGGDPALVKLLAQLAQAEAEYDGAQLAQLYQQMTDLDGYTAESRAAKLLVGLGFLQSDLQRPIDDFSGGWRMRLNLARVLMTPADLLLLDEPTNHLDLEAIVWLEQWLKDLPQTILIISHDREFLDHVVKRIVHFDQQTLTMYTGNYSDFEEQYAAALMQQAAAFAAQQRQLQHLQSYVDRFRYKASKARQAQSRLKAIERMDKVAAVHMKNPFQFSFYPAPDVGNPLISFSHLDIGYADKIILPDVSFSIYQGDRIALIGPNGAGKSTLVKAIAGILPLTGKISRNNKLKIGYFTQHQLEDLRLDESCMWHLKQLDPRLPEKDARQFLGGFNFRDDRVFEPIRNFSGGEKARLALALLVLQKPNLLLLDEPSNHLDLEMREALAHALQSYEGALLLITHDRYLIKALADDLYLVAQGKVTRFEDDLSTYEQWLLTANLVPTVTKPEKKEAPKKVIKSANTEKKIEKLELQLAQKQKTLNELEQQLVAHYSEPTKMGNIEILLTQQKQLQQEIEKLENELLELL